MSKPKHVGESRRAPLATGTGVMLPGPVGARVPSGLSLLGEPSTLQAACCRELPRGHGIRRNARARVAGSGTEHHAHAFAAGQRGAVDNRLLVSDTTAGFGHGNGEPRDCAQNLIKQDGPDETKAALFYSSLTAPSRDTACHQIIGRDALTRRNAFRVQVRRVALKHDRDPDGTTAARHSKRARAGDPLSIVVSCLIERFDKRGPADHIERHRGRLPQGLNAGPARRRSEALR